ncbi:MAG TPA: hypothetical protein VF137_05475 [Candidatus Dormibacteraeota bacterium]
MKNEDIEMLPERERSRVIARDKKVRGPRVVEDNPGLKKLQLQLALRRRSVRSRPR